MRGVNASSSIQNLEVTHNCACCQKKSGPANPNQATRLENSLGRPSTTKRSAESPESRTQTNNARRSWSHHTTGPPHRRSLRGPIRKCHLSERKVQGVNAPSSARKLEVVNKSGPVNAKPNHSPGELIGQTSQTSPPSLQNVEHKPITLGGPGATTPRDRLTGEACEAQPASATYPNARCRESCIIEHPESRNNP
jgi:hypothetical protein